MDIQRQLLLKITSLSAAGNARLEDLFTTVPLPHAERCRERISGLVTTGGVAVDSELIGSLPALRVIATRGVGYDHIDMKAAQKRKIAVCNTPDVLSDCVADLAIGALIAVSRQLLNADRFVRNGEWPQKTFPLTNKVSTKRLGIVGMGRIGRAVAHRARGFAMPIKYHSRTPRTDRPEGFEPSLPQLARWADFLVICAPGGPSTRNLISAEILEELGKKGYLINVARGSLVDEPALIRALSRGTIAGAALDVFADEPRVPQRLIDADNVVLFPHIASGTQETFAAMENLMIDNLQSFFSHGTLLTPVTDG